MNKEKQLEEALRELAIRMDDPEVRAVFELNVRETHNHYLLIEAEYARIMGMVDLPERALRAYPTKRARPGNPARLAIWP